MTAPAATWRPPVFAAGRSRADARWRAALAHLTDPRPVETTITVGGPAVVALIEGAARQVVAELTPPERRKLLAQLEARGEHR